MRLKLTLLLGTLLLIACNRNSEPVPATPAGVTTTVQGDAIEVRWQDESDDETGFIIYRRTEQTELEELATTAPDTEVYLDEDVDPTETYVYAVSTQGELASSEPVETEPIKLETPTQPTPTGNTLLIERIGDGTGIVTNVSPPEPSINCGADCTETYQVNPITLTLQAEPDEGSVFVGWTENCVRISANRCNVTVAGSPVAVSAEFREASSATINTFSAEPARIFSGQSSTLSWDVVTETAVTLELGDSDGNSLDISDKGLQDSLSVSPDGDTTYTLTATTLAGTNSAEVTVQVNPAPTIERFTVTPGSIPQGEAATLRWEVTGVPGTTLRLSVKDGEDIDISSKTLTDSVTVNPSKSTTYVLTASNPAGSSSQELTLVVGIAPIIASLTASPATINEGDSSRLSWDIERSVTKLTLSDGETERDVTGRTSISVSPGATTRYRLTAENAFGSSSETVVVTVNQKPIISSFSASKTTVEPGETFRLEWEIENQETLTSLDILSGSRVISVPGNPRTIRRINASKLSSGVIRLRATNAAGETISEPVTITVSDDDDDLTGELETVSRVIID